MRQKGRGGKLKMIDSASRCTKKEKDLLQVRVEMAQPWTTKRIVSFLTALLMAGSFAACGDPGCFRRSLRNAFQQRLHSTGSNRFHPGIQRHNGGIRFRSYHYRRHIGSHRSHSNQHIAGSHQSAPFDKQLVYNNDNGGAASERVL